MGHPKLLKVTLLFRDGWLTGARQAGDYVGGFLFSHAHYIQMKESKVALKREGDLYLSLTYTHPIQ